MNTNRFSTKITLLLVSTLTVMAGATIAPALPSLQAHFSEVKNVGLWIRLVLTLPGLFIVLAAPVAGYLLDRGSRLRLLVPAMLLYGIAGSSGLYLDSVGSILAGRALLGVAVAGIMTSATTLIADYYEGPARSRFMGWQAAFMNLGGVIFLTSGGGLAELGWRWPFAIYLLAILMIPLVFTALGDPEKPTVKKEFSKTENNGKAKAGFSPLLIFIYGVAFGGMIIFYFIPVHIPFYLEKLTGAGPTISGMAIALATFCSTVTAFSYGRIRNRLGYLSILALTFGLMGIGYLLIALGNSYPVVLTGLSVGGLGMGLMFPNLNVWLTTEVPAAVRGRAVGGFTTAVFLGQFISPVAGQPIVDLFGIGKLFGIAGIFLLNISLAVIVWKKPILDFTRQVKQREVKQDTVTETVSVKTKSQKNGIFLKR